jgi:hypothetical protein
MKSRIIRRENIHLLEVNGEILPLYGYMSYQPAKACYEAFKKVGVKLFFLPVRSLSASLMISAISREQSEQIANPSYMLGI